MKVTAPYKKFRWKHYYFPLGFRYCSKKEVQELKKVPIGMGELKANDRVINKPKKSKKK